MQHGRIGGVKSLCGWVNHVCVGRAEFRRQAAAVTAVAEAAASLWRCCEVARTRHGMSPTSAWRMPGIVETDDSLRASETNSASSRKPSSTPCMAAVKHGSSTGSAVSGEAHTALSWGRWMYSSYSSCTRALPVGSRLAAAGGAGSEGLLSQSTPGTGCNPTEAGLGSAPAAKGHVPVILKGAPCRRVVRGFANERADAVGEIWKRHMHVPAGCSGFEVQNGGSEAYLRCTLTNFKMCCECLKRASGKVRAYH